MSFIKINIILGGIMMKAVRIITKFLLTIAVILISSFLTYGNSAYANNLPNTYFISNNGNDDNDGKTIDTAFKTFTKAADLVEPGDTVKICAGVYYEQVILTKSGTEKNPITWEAYGDGTVVIDGINRQVNEYNPTKMQAQLFVKSCNYQVIRNMTIRNSPSFGLGDFSYPSSYNIYENLYVHDNCGCGMIIRGNYNKLINCVASYNFDYVGCKEWGAEPGEDADGISPDGSYNYLSGCIAYNNSDDGFDCWYADHTIMENCIAYSNGTNDGCRNRDHGEWKTVKFEGNGNGFKMGRGGDINTNNLYQACNILSFCLSYDNQSCGFNSNGGGGNEYYNCTASNNVFRDFQWYDVIGENGEVLNNIPTIVKNNIAYSYKVDDKGKTIGGISRDNERVTQENNSWNFQDIQLTKDDFISQDPLSCDFMKLSENSSCIDRGIDIGFAYDGASPDLGFYEFIKSETENPGTGAQDPGTEESGIKPEVPGTGTQEPGTGSPGVIIDNPGSNLDNSGTDTYNPTPVYNENGTTPSNNAAGDTGVNDKISDILDKGYNGSQDQLFDQITPTSKNGVFYFERGIGPCTSQFRRFSSYSSYIDSILLYRKIKIKIIISENNGKLIAEGFGTTIKIKLGNNYTLISKIYGINEEDIEWTTSKDAILLVDKNNGNVRTVKKGIEYIQIKAGNIVKNIKVIV